MALAPIDFPNDPEFGESVTGTNGITYTWLGDRWRTNVGNVDINVNPEDVLVNSLFDVSVPDPDDGDVVFWNNQNSKWEAKPVEDLTGDLTNIVYSDQNTRITGEFLFETDPILKLPQLNDVNVSDVQIGDTIKWSGSDGGWVNGPACEEDANHEHPEYVEEAPIDGTTYGRRNSV